MRSTELIEDNRQSLIDETIRCWPWMEAAMRRGMPDGILTHNLDDMIQMVLAGDAQIWSSPSGVMITYVTTFPRCRIVQVWMMGGDFEEVMEANELAIIEWAKSIGAALLYVQGRKGWTRRLASRGWKEHQAIVTLNLMEQNDGKSVRNAARPVGREAGVAEPA